MTAATLTVLFLILWAEFVNGWTDAPNAIATVVSTRVLAPRTAVALAVLMNSLLGQVALERVVGMQRPPGPPAPAGGDGPALLGVA